MTTFTTTVQSIFTLPQVEGHTDVVVNVVYSTLGVNGAYTASVKFPTKYTLQQGGEFTPYKNLTQEQVIGWIPKSQIISTQAVLQEQLNAMANPPVPPASQPLPWAA